MTGTNNDSVGQPTGESQLAKASADEAARLWMLAADRSRWGLVDEATELRNLATVKRVEAVLRKFARTGSAS